MFLNVSYKPSVIETENVQGITREMPLCTKNVTL